MAHRIPRLFPVFRASPREPGRIPASGACSLGLRTCPPLENPQTMPFLSPTPREILPRCTLTVLPFVLTFTHTLEKGIHARAHCPGRVARCLMSQAPQTLANTCLCFFTSLPELPWLLGYRSAQPQRATPGRPAVGLLALADFRILTPGSRSRATAPGISEL